MMSHDDTTNDSHHMRSPRRYAGGHMGTGMGWPALARRRASVRGYARGEGGGWAWVIVDDDHACGLVGRAQSVRAPMHRRLYHHCMALANGSPVDTVHMWNSVSANVCLCGGERAGAESGEERTVCERACLWHMP